MDVQLFLAHADDHQPVLDEGVPLHATFEEPAPDTPSLPLQRLANIHAPPDALPEQQWAIVAPKGPIGDRLLALVAPLRRYREEEQGQEAIVYRVDPGMDAVAAANWIQKEYRDRVGRLESARPRYLALLGNPDVISWDLQQMLGGEAFVGRIAFDDENGYEAYVNKVLRYADAREAPRATALFHAVQDGSRAAYEGNRHLMLPTLEMARTAKTAGTFDAQEMIEIPMAPTGSSLDPSAAAGALLQQSTRARAALLFTISHGAGVPIDGWKSPAEQRARQGAMVLGRKGDLLTANDVTNTPFLPGGVWFMFACYSAGTPSRSAYFPWLEKLHALGILGKSPSNVLAALPRSGEAPFVAALPQAALANPDGPLGVVGHVDLAWSWSFLDYNIESTGFVPKSRAERFQGILQAFVNGHRFGVAHHELVRFFRSVNMELTASYEAHAQRMIVSPEVAEEPISKVRRANLWMQRQDLSAHVLLGDPAARLPITRCPPGIHHHASTSFASFASIDAERTTDREDAVLAVLRGTASLTTMAARRGVSRDEIERWVGIFVEAGRAGLAKNP